MINKIHNMDCIEGMKMLEDNSADSIVTDPPYGLSKPPDIKEVLMYWLQGEEYLHNKNGFMSNSWDSFVPSPNIWKEAIRVLKPGGHILCFAGTRTVDLMGISLRLAGFEIRDMLAWVYGSGFPKGQNISKGIDKKLGLKRDVIGKMKSGVTSRAFQSIEHIIAGEYNLTAPASLEAEQWEGWNTGIKPALEPIILARKPISEKTIVDNVLKWGTSAINVDDCRIGSFIGGWQGSPSKGYSGGLDSDKSGEARPTKGRFPANVIFDEFTGKILDKQSGISKSTGGSGKKSRGALGKNIYNTYALNVKGTNAGGLGDSGGASRYFKSVDYVEEDFVGFQYCPKASKKERGEYNNHATVKPLKLMRYLVRLITPPGGIVLDLFSGSGTTALACIKEEFSYIGFEISKEYCDIAEKRIVAAVE